MTLANHSSRIRTGVAVAALLLSCIHPALQAQHSLTPGEFAVNDAGASTYSIPILVAPGVGGLSPRLKLQYSSQAANGVFGVGWALSGISSITRCAKTPAEEGDRVGVQNNATDVFCLDGEKLRVSNGGAYGAANTQYRTAIDTYGRITSLGNVAGGPQSFTLETRTGEIYTFGGVASPNSWLEHPAKGVIRTWMVSEIRDRFNNRISFSYTKNTGLGEQLLTLVDYSNGQIQLNYQARPANDQIVKFDDGVQYGSTSSIVGSITVAHKPLVGGTPTVTPFKTYQLAYTQSQASQRSMLRSITECAPDGACLPATSLTYRDGTPGVFAQSPAPTYSLVAPGSPTKFGIRDVQGNGIQSVYMFRTNVEVVPPNPYAPSMVVSDLLLWDFDGDSATDIVSYQQEYSEFGAPYLVIEFASGGEQRSPWNPNPQQVWIACAADLNGDGVSELITGYTRFQGGSNSGRYYYYVTNPFGGADFAAGDFQTLGGCKPMDIDGDGRSELFFNSNTILSNVGGVWVRRSNVSAQFLTGLSADFNGDGKTDAVQSSSGPLGPAEKRTYQSTGASAFESWSTSIGGVACVGDFNGDGRSDVLLGQNRLDLSNGNTKTTVSQNVASSYLSIKHCGDFNGDGLMDVAINTSTTSGHYFYNTLPADVDRLISVNNGGGFVQEVSYKSITDNTVYTKGTGSVKPQIDMQTPIMVVASVRSGNSLKSGGGWNTTSYRYANLRADLRRSGTQGFERVTSFNQGTGVSVATHYHQHHPLTGQVSRVHKFVGSEAAPQTLENTTQGYLTRTFSATVTQVHLDKSTSTFFDLRQPGVLIGSQRKAMSIDAYGFPLEERTESLDANGAVTSANTANHTYNHQMGTWLLGQLVRTTTSAQNQRTLLSTAPPTTPLTLQVNPTEVVANVAGPGPWSGAVSVTAQGATPPYTYAWTRTAGTRTAFSNASIANPTISVTLAAGEEFNETLRVTVTDANGVSAFREVPVRYVTPFPFTPTITANTSNYNLRAAAVAAGWNQTSPLRAVVTVNAGVMLSANTVSAFAFDTGAGFPAGSTLALINNGSIIGMGGAGGAGGRFILQGAPGQAGGPALRAQSPLVLTNNGTIASGGNGGAGGAGWTKSGSGATTYRSGASGGGGRTGATNSAGANPGTAAAPGAGGSAGFGAPASANGQPGGQYGGGAAVVGNGNVVWQATGTRLGALN